MLTKSYINPDEWRPVCRWLRKWLDRAYDPPGLFLEENTRPVLDRMLRKARRTRRHDYLTMTMNQEDAGALRQQLLFWECAQDELPKNAREEAPSWTIFAELRLDIEGALMEQGW